MPNNPPLELSPAIAAYAAKLRGLDLPPAGGRIRGPGTVRSDSVPARVAETGEAIKVSNKERIVSAEQESLLNAIAQGAGYKSLDAMFKDFGMPAGPVIKGGKRHAADGMAPEPDEPKPITSPASQNQPQEGRIQAAIAAPPSLSAGASYGRSEPVGKLSGPAGGLSIDPPGQGSPNFADDSQAGLNTRLAAMQKANGGVDSVTAQFNNAEQNKALSRATTSQNPLIAGLSEKFNPAQAGSVTTKPGRDASGVITADSAKAAYGNDMQRPGGVFGTMDMAGVNGILERENKARAGMIDSMIAANGGNGVAILPDRTNEDNEKLQAMKLSPKDYLEYQKNKVRQESILADSAAARGLTMRGQDLALQRAQERNDVIARGQDVRADVAGERIASNEAIAGARIAERAGRPEQTGRLTTAQQRSNAEIDAARTAIAGLTPEEIKRKTANFTATGRENPDFDPTLAKSVSQANRRKFGDDQEFDQRQQPQQPAGAADHGYDRKDVAQRFRSERAMDRYKLGNDTPNGVEVLDSAGKVVGHYR